MEDGKWSSFFAEWFSVVPYLLGIAMLVFGENNNDNTDKNKMMVTMTDGNGTNKNAKNANHDHGIR